MVPGLSRSVQNHARIITVSTSFHPRLQQLVHYISWSLQLEVKDHLPVLVWATEWMPFAELEQASG